MNKQDFKQIHSTLKQAIGQPLGSAAVDAIIETFKNCQHSSSVTLFYSIDNRAPLARGHGSDGAYLSPLIDILVICDERAIIRQLICFDRQARPEDFGHIPCTGCVSAANHRVD